MLLLQQAHRQLATGNRQRATCNSCCCLWRNAGNMLSVQLQQQQQPLQPLLLASWLAVSSCSLLDFVNLLTIWSYFCMLYCQFGGHWPFTWLAPVACPLSLACLLLLCRSRRSFCCCCCGCSFWHTTHNVWQFGRLPGPCCYSCCLDIALGLANVAVVAVVSWLVAHTPVMLIWQQDGCGLVDSLDALQRRNARLLS